MPELDQLFDKPGVKAFGEAQCYEATVVALSARGVYVVLPSYDSHLRWGPCRPEGAQATVGQHVAVALSEDGTPWLLGGGGDGSSDPNIDGGEPDSVYGGDLPVIDGGGV